VAAGLTLVCPIRGRLKARGKSADGLRPSEERLRVEAIRHLLGRGYPEANFKVEAVVKRFGHGGRNSFRADLAVLDVPVSAIPPGDVDALLEHAVVLVEVKRDNADAEAAKSFQVRPMLDFAHRADCVALYWDDIEQRVYWRTLKNGLHTPHEGPLVSLPAFGERPAAPHLTFNTLDATKPLLDAFRRIEDTLHAASIGPAKRYGVILQLLLAKLYDEHHHVAQPDVPVDIQDFGSLGVDPVIAAERFDRVLADAVSYYQQFLPEKVGDKLKIPANVLMDVLRVLAPIKVVALRQSVIQDFYMYFARHLYKWDMAQYFTPTSLTDFIVEMLNPGFGEHIRDPACGSADFLTAAFRRGQSQGFSDYASSVGGSDVSREAVQVAVLNMILNGDGKTNVQQEDSLVKVSSNAESCRIVVCNPPFGTRILERRHSVLAEFDLGHEWGFTEEGHLDQRDKVLSSQETGIMFAELCVRLVVPGGRIALIVPNGYLGNVSTRYHALREWLLRHCRVAAIVAFPRFTFKSSGADVSASVIFLEKRETPITRASDDDDYEVAIEIVDRVGWSVGDKRAAPLYRRDPTDGTLMLDDQDDQILDSDLPDVLTAVRSSDAAEHFPWLRADTPAGDAGWTIPAGRITGDGYCTSDPKRLCRKVSEVRAAIEARPHFPLGDILDPIPERRTSTGAPVQFTEDGIYRYVEIGDAAVGTYRWQEMRGWELPDRAKHLAEPGDLYLGGIWGSVRKWLFIGTEDPPAIVVTNGFLRVRLKATLEAESMLLDLVAGLCTEAYTTQMRALARGSDGLAEVSADDAMKVLLPRIVDADVRAELQPFIEQVRGGHTSTEAKITALLGRGVLATPIVPARPDHTAVV